MDNDNELQPISPAEAFHDILESERRYWELANKHDTSVDTEPNSGLETQLTPEDLDAAEKFYYGDRSEKSIDAATRLVAERQSHLEALNLKTQVDLKTAKQAMEFVQTSKVPA